VASYRISFRPHAHLIDVEARWSNVSAPATLRLAAWTPGSYLVRDYARHIQGMTGATKIEKAAWRAEPQGGDVVVRYSVYAYELTVRTSHVDATHAFVNGAPTFLWLEGREREPAEVTIVVPSGWEVTTALAAVGASTWRAADLDELIDSPIHAAPGPVHEITAAGKSLAMSIWGHFEPGPAATMSGFLGDVAKIVEEHARLFGGLPFDRYAFMLLLAPGAYGGLEHKASTALLSTPFAFASRKKYEELLELVSHEFFHLWNVKRIRPTQLGPFDYTRENYTRSLWVAEGVTSYFDRLALRRARLQSVKRYLEKLAEEWGTLVGIAGRRQQSIEESSFDAWIKLYRPDENTANSTVSYYLKGALVTIALDLEIRRRTNGARSMDDVLRALWRDHREVSYADADVEKIFARAVELDLTSFFDRFVRGREDPDLAGALRAAGLILRPKEKDNKDGDEPKVQGWIGANLKSDASGHVLVKDVPAGGPGEEAGIYAGDEIVALDGFRVDEKELKDRAALRRPGEVVQVTLFRRDELRAIEVRLGEKPKDWEIVQAPEQTTEEKALQKGWLGED
jgi:predicted metalloprotease with PDZ domain